MLTLNKKNSNSNFCTKVLRFYLNLTKIGGNAVKNCRHKTKNGIKCRFFVF